MLSIFMIVIIKMTPKKMLDITSKLKDKSQKKRQQMIQRIKNAKLKSKEGALSSLKILLSSKKIITKNLDVLTHFVQGIELKKVKPGLLWTGVTALLTPLFLKLKSIYLTMKPITFLSLVLTGSVGTLTGIQVYKSTKQIQEKSNPHQRKPASAYTDRYDLGQRPKYYRRQRKQFLVAMITLPVYVESVNSYKSLVIDYTIETSNRFTREFLMRNEILLKDALNSKIEPVVPTFPLQREGKNVIADKIKREISNLIKKQGIEGYIENVYINNIIGA